MEPTNKKHINLNNESDSLVWGNGKKVFIHSHSEYSPGKTYTVMKRLPSNFSISVKMIKINNKCEISVGVVNRIPNSESDFMIGWSYEEERTWGLKGDGTIGEEGEDNRKYTNYNYTDGDTLTIHVSEGVVEYSINNIRNAEYSYDMKTTNLYLAASVFNRGDSLEIVEESL